MCRDKLRKGKCIHTWCIRCALRCVPSGSRYLLSWRCLWLWVRNRAWSPRVAAAPALGAGSPLAGHLRPHDCLLLIWYRTITETACTWAFSLWGFSWDTESEDKQSYTGRLICLFSFFPLFSLRDSRKTHWTSKLHKWVESDHRWELSFFQLSECEPSGV